MADIVSYNGIGLYPPFVAGIINAAWNEGLDKANDMSLKVGLVADELSQQAAPTVTAGTAEIGSIAEPPVDIPETQSAGDVMSLFDTKYLELVAMLSDKFVAFRNTYFPDEQNVYAAAEDWLQAALASDTGIAPAVAAQILTDDKDRIVADASRAGDALLAQFASRRFPLPPGAAAAALLDVTNKAQDEIATTGRKIVIASIEQLRWVVGQVVTLRQSAMDSAIKYITALASGPEMASRLVGIGYDAQSKLISAASQFYNSRIAAAEATAKVSQFNANLGLEAATKNQAAELTLIEDRLKALLTECQAIAQMATALFNNVQASASVSASDSVSTSL